MLSKNQLAKNLPVWPIFLLIAISLAITAWGVVYLLSIGYSANSLPRDVKIPGNASLVLVCGDGEERVFLGKALEGMTVYHALLASAKAGNFRVDTSFSQDGIIIEEINGRKNTEEKTWHYYVNGEYKDMLSPRNERIKSGDRIEFRYE